MARSKPRPKRTDGPAWGEADPYPEPKTPERGYLEPSFVERGRGIKRDPRPDSPPALVGRVKRTYPRREVLEPSR